MKHLAKFELYLHNMIQIKLRFFFLFFFFQVLKEDSVFVVASKRSIVDKCSLPAGIRLFVSAAHSESDLLKACESLKRVSASVLSVIN